MWGALKKLRQSIHQYPELSGHEEETSRKLLEFLGEHTRPTKIVRNIGGHGFLVTYNTRIPGPTIMIRAELDAIPVSETNRFAYRSTILEASHKCGHDGHMAILAALGLLLSKNKMEKGRVILLFQPAEENGTGAKLVLQDKRFERYQPDYIFALHNVPGYPLGQVVMRDRVFSSASAGMIIRLNGKTSHAAEPELGINPIYAVAELVESIKPYGMPVCSENNHIKLITPVHTRVGNKTFGTSPGYAELMLTIRATTDTDFELLKKEIEEKIRVVTRKYDLTSEIEFAEEFPNVINSEECNRAIAESARINNLSVLEEKSPFKWSEDFGHFTQKYKGAMFGLGAGIAQPPLHNSDYDFPNDLIKTGAELFHSIIKTTIASHQ